MNQKSVILAVVSSIFILGAGILILSPAPKKADNDVSCNLSPEKISTKSDNINVSVHVDGSGSMLGYVNSSNSIYIKTLDLLYNTFSFVKSRPNTTVEYYRAGNKNQTLTTSDFRKAQQRDFYTGDNTKFPPVTSGLDSSIPLPGKEDKLVVLVTDLYQNDADVTKLNKKIQETYFNQQRKGYAVGILAIKSEFNGQVYVLSGNQEPFPYNTQGKTPAQFRPFYILFIGPYPDVVLYLEKIKNDAKGFLDVSESVIFSPNHFVSDLSSLITSKPEITREVKETLRQTKSLNNGQVALQVKDNSAIRLWNIHNQSSQRLSFSDTVDFAPLKYSLPIDDKSIQTNIKVENIDSKQSGDTAQPPLQLENWNINQNKLSFTTVINPQAIQKPGIYSFTVDAIAKELQEQPWWSDWSWTAGRDRQDDGSKTHNLSNFLGGLKTLTTELMETEQPVIGRFCYAIQKN